MTTQIPGAVTLDSVLVPSQQQVSCDVAGEAVILNLRDGVYYGLNSGALEIWNLLQRNLTVAQVCDALLQEYPELDADQCSRDVFGFLGQLLEWQLIEFAPAS